MNWEARTHRSRDRTDCPAQRVEVLPRPLGAVDLLLQLLGENVLGVVDVQVSEVHEELTHRLVQHDGIALLHELTDDLALLILDNEDLWKA